MKKIILLFLSIIVTKNFYAQQNLCSDFKSKRSVSKSHVISLPPGYVPPENSYDLKFYNLNLNVERNSLYISGNVKSIAKVVTASLDSFAFVLHQNHTIDSVYINGVRRYFVNRDSLVLASVGAPIAQNQDFEAIVYYKGTCPNGASAAIGNGYNSGTSGSWGNEVTWSLSESFVAYEWFPCKQDLKDKIDSLWVFATTSSANKTGSNGLLTNTVSVAGGKTRYEWKSKYPIAYYLISVATAEYIDYKQYAKPQYLVNDSILIQNYIYNTTLGSTTQNWTNQTTALSKMPATLNLLSNLFGMYPFYKEKYGHCMAPFSGGMEHQTMTSLGFFDFEIDAHELAHQWWGDHVTCKAWKDIFINEGFASYAEYLSCQYMPTISGKSATAKMNEVHTNVMSAVGGSAYFTNADTLNTPRIFDSRLTYDKGSAIIHSLRYEINNDSTFFNALRAFQTTYSNSVTSVIEFKQFMETYTSMNFTQFFNQWYYGQGYPTFNVKWNQIGNSLLIETLQTQSVPSSVPLFITPLDYRITRAGLPDTIVRVMHAQTTENYTIAVGSNSVTNIFPDPNNWILNKIVGPTKDVNLGSITSIQEILEPMIFVGPNPTSDVLNIYLYNQSAAIVEITDITGKLVYKAEISNQKTIDVTNFANGIYSVDVKNTNGRLIKNTKLVKQ